jgi:hypothetical protein
MLGTFYVNRAVPKMTSTAIDLIDSKPLNFPDEVRS